MNWPAILRLWRDPIFGTIANDNLWPFAYRYWRR